MVVVVPSLKVLSTSAAVMRDEVDEAVSSACVDELVAVIELLVSSKSCSAIDHWDCHFKLTLSLGSWPSRYAKEGVRESDECEEAVKPHVEALWGLNDRI